MTYECYVPTCVTVWCNFLPSAVTRGSLDPAPIFHTIGVTHGRALVESLQLLSRPRGRLLGRLFADRGKCRAHLLELHG